MNVIFKSFIVRDLNNQKLIPEAVVQDQVLQESSLIQLKVACRAQIRKKSICQNGDKFGYSFI